MDDLFDDDKPFRAIVGESRARSARESYYAANSVHKTSSSFSSSAMGRGRPVGTAPHSFQQRAVVKLTTKKLAGSGRSKARAHLDYLQRDGAGGPDRPPALFGSEPDSEPDADDFFRRCEDDRHQFRIILSPENGDQLDLEEYTRDVMERAEQDLDAELDWIAVTHHNTDNPHAHVVLRGRDLRRDEDLYIHPQYMNAGLRQRAQEVATHELGPRRESDIRAAQQKQVEQDRLTDLDRRLLAASDENGRISPAEMPGRDAQEQKLHRRRVEHLVESDLATAGDDHWQLDDDLRGELRRRGRRRDVIQRLHRAGRDPEQGARTGRPEQTRLARVAHRGLADDHTGDRYLIADGADGRTYYVDDDQQLAETAPPGAVIQIGDDAPRGTDAVLCESRPVEAVDYQGPTFLDHPDTHDALENTTERGDFYHELAAHMEKRRAFLQEHDVELDPQGRPHFPDLRDFEKRAHLEKVAERRERTPVELSDGDKIRGRVVDELHLEAGSYLAVATDDERIALVPSNRYTAPAADEPGPVEITVDEREDRTRHYVDYAPRGHLAQVVETPDDDSEKAVVRTTDGEQRAVDLPSDLREDLDCGDIVRVGRNAPDGADAHLTNRRSAQTADDFEPDIERFQRALAAEKIASPPETPAVDLAPGESHRGRVGEDIDVDGVEHVAFHTDDGVAVVPKSDSLETARRHNLPAQIDVQPGERLTYEAELAADNKQTRGPER